MPKRGMKEISPSSVVYKGPIKRAVDKSATDLHTQTVMYTEFISSSAAGKLISVFSDNLTNFEDFTELKEIYDEYRTLGLRLDYFPCNRYSKTTTLCRPAVSVIDRDDATVLSTYLDSVGASSAKIESLEDPWSREIKMNGIEDASFIDTASTTARQYIKIYADGLSASVEYGMIVLTCLVQFRGRR
jgi:hypothetical protein